jgi:hypothetical protein
LDCDIETSGVSLYSDTPFRKIGKCAEDIDGTEGIEGVEGKEAKKAMRE